MAGALGSGPSGGLHEDAQVIAVGAEEESLAGGSGGVAEPFLKVGIELARGDVEGAGLDVGDAEFAPGGEGEVVDQDLGGGGGGAVLIEESVAQGFIERGVLAGDDGAFGGEAVAEGVEARGGFALEGAGAGARLRVA
ncbi:MAG: hypothetical protein HYS04_03990, partial [Acidobacteria bacterium]|nr:hypothetical protein [Acidobacteriota bacterium]